MFYLYQVRHKDGSQSCTRGENENQALRFYRNVEKQDVELLDYCAVKAAYCYSVDHPFDWINNPPRWLSPNHRFVPNDCSFKDRFYNPKIKRVI